MNLNFKRLLTTQFGIIVISVILGLGLASLFRKVCNDKNCIVFNGPVIDEINGKTYKFSEKCYQYEMVPGKCDMTKKIVNVKSKVDETL